MRLGIEELKTLLRLVDVTEAEEIDCDELLERLGSYVEGLGEDGTPPPGAEDVVQHLRVCPECLEEVQALYEAFRDERDREP